MGTDAGLSLLVSHQYHRYSLYICCTQIPFARSRFQMPNSIRFQLHMMGWSHRQQGPQVWMGRYQSSSLQHQRDGAGFVTWHHRQLFWGLELEEVVSMGKHCFHYHLGYTFWREGLYKAWPYSAKSNQLLMSEAFMCSHMKISRRTYQRNP